MDIERPTITDRLEREAKDTSIRGGTKHTQTDRHTDRHTETYKQEDRQTETDGQTDVLSSTQPPTLSGTGNE